VNLDMFLFPNLNLVVGGEALGFLIQSQLLIKFSIIPNLSVNSRT